ncbi:MAG: type II secretion system F family protein [Candidatus Nanopelagicales bacterium]
MRLTAAGALVGMLASVGMLLVFGWVLARRRPAMAARIAPYVGRPGAVAPAGHGMRGLLATPVRPGDRRPRPGVGPEAVIWACLGAGLAGLIAMFALQASPLAAVAFAAGGGAAALAAHRRHGARASRRRRDSIERQLPVVADLLAFAVAAGESPFMALCRASEQVHGPLADDVAAAVASIRAGYSLESALRALADRTGSQEVDGFIDGLLAAMERGTPLAESLRAQAADARARSRQRLVEQAGRKDVAMLVPVVFLILPTVVVIALFPGLHALRLVVP